MVFENGKKVPLEENEWKEKQENMPAYCNHPFWQVKNSNPLKAQNITKHISD